MGTKTSTPEERRAQARSMRQSAQYAEGACYHREMQAADALDIKAKQLEADQQRKTARRKKDLAKIHLLAKQAGLTDDDAYRDMLQQLTGQRSSGKLNATQRGKVIAHLKRTAGKQSRYPGKPNNIDSNLQLQKIEALLAEAKYPWSYAAKIAQRMYKKDRLEFCDSSELSGVITALIKDAEKHGRRVK